MMSIGETLVEKKEFLQDSLSSNGLGEKHGVIAVLQQHF
jgi:hypothetical protein